MPVARGYHYQLAICTPDYVGARLRPNLKWRDQRQAAKLSQLRDNLCLPAPKTQVVRSTTRGDADTRQGRRDSPRCPAVS